jgi:predicted PurR-regulated permease PerM
MMLLITALGSIFLVAIPNLFVDAVRFRFGDPERLSQTMYFVGFVGGGLTVGLVGFVVGPLVLTVLVTLVGLLARASTAELRRQPG